MERIAQNPTIKQQELVNATGKSIATVKRIIENKPFLMTAHGLSDRVQYVELKATSGLSDYHSDIAQISMAIQC